MMYIMYYCETEYLAFHVGLEVCTTMQIANNYDDIQVNL